MTHTYNVCSVVYIKSAYGRKTYWISSSVLVLHICQYIAPSSVVKNSSVSIYILDHKKEIYLVYYGILYKELTAGLAICQCLNRLNKWLFSTVCVGWLRAQFLPGHLYFDFGVHGLFLVYYPSPSGANKYLKKKKKKNVDHTKLRWFN